MAFHFKRHKESWCRRYSDCIWGWIDWIPTRNWDSLFQNRDSVVCDSSNPEYNKICFLQRNQTAYSCPQTCICSINRRNCIDGTGQPVENTIPAMLDINKKWTGHWKDWGRFVPSWKISLKSDWKDYKQNTTRRDWHSQSCLTC